jgi:hypothetical protein
MDERKLLARLAMGVVANVAAHSDIPQLINLQSVRGQAKPYQVRQLMRLVERYDLRLRDRP